MNIFILDASPKWAAAYLSDQHLNKMLLETAQILCDVALDLGQPTGEVPYKHTKGNQLPQKWASQSIGAWNWTVEYGIHLSGRQGWQHASCKVIAAAAVDKLRHPCSLSATQFPKTWADDPVPWYPNDPVRSHRLYYERKRQLWATRGKTMTWTSPGIEPPKADE